MTRSAACDHSCCSVAGAAVRRPGCDGDTMRCASHAVWHGSSPRRAGNWLALALAGTLQHPLAGVLLCRFSFAGPARIWHIARHPTHLAETVRHAKHTRQAVKTKPAFRMFDTALPPRWRRPLGRRRPIATQKMHQFASIGRVGMRFHSGPCSLFGRVWFSFGPAQHSSGEHTLTRASISTSVRSCAAPVFCLLPTAPVVQMPVVRSL